MLRASATPINGAVSRPGTAWLAQARACAGEGLAFPIGRAAGRARLEGQGVALQVDLAAEWACLRLSAEAVAP